MTVEAKSNLTHSPTKFHLFIYLFYSTKDILIYKINYFMMINPIILCIADFHYSQSYFFLDFR